MQDFQRGRLQGGGPGLPVRAWLLLYDTARYAMARQLHGGEKPRWPGADDKHGRPGRIPHLISLSNGPDRAIIRPG